MRKVFKVAGRFRVEMKERSQFGRKVQWTKWRTKSEQETEMVAIFSSSYYRNMKIVTHQYLICIFSYIPTQLQ